MNTPHSVRPFGPASLLFGKLLPAFALVFLAASSQATTVIPPTFDQLVGKADYIVRAVVKNVTAEMRADGPGRHIVTKVELDVRQIISGTPPATVVLEMLGGQVGTERMVVDGMPTFQVGDEDILFVRGNGKSFSPLVAMMHGRYPVLKDSTGREYVARANGAPLYSELDVSQPMGGGAAHLLAKHVTPPLSPADFVSRIQGVVKFAPRAGAQN